MEVIGSIYTGVTADFQRVMHPIARCVKAEQHDLGVVMADVSFPDRATRCGRVQECGNVFPTIMAQNQELYRIETQYRIRKLTPRECGRLMGVSDEDVSKMELVNSNTQLYKQFGNSIVVDVMCEMFKNLNIDQ
jgi:DNA (cytosine-5)-methyltransferase 1